MTTLVLDAHTRSWSDGRVVAGGSPWRLSKLAPSAAAIIHRLRIGPIDDSQFDPRAVRLLLNRGLVHPWSASMSEEPRTHTNDLTIAIPVYENVDGLRQALATLRGHRIIVVDDGSPNHAQIAQVSAEFGVTLITHDHNRGPAAARNTALAATQTEFIAFLDSDGVATGAWPSSAIWHFDDSEVALVAPRITSLSSGNVWIDRYESVRGSLDMGPVPSVVRPEARISYVPGAALVARTDTLRDFGFAESLRVGEDVDLVWRLAAGGLVVRYDPSTIVDHRNRATLWDWMRQRHAYGTSVAALESRHRDSVSPWRPSLLGATSLALLAAGRPFAAVLPCAATAGIVQSRLGLGQPSGTAAAEVALRGWVHDAASLGHALRREWWPMGLAACLTLAVRPRSTSARLAVACMAIPVITDWWRVRARIPLSQYAAMRVLDDASYGTGVIHSAIRDRSWRVLTPKVAAIKRRPGRSGRRDLAPSTGR